MIGDGWKFTWMADIYGTPWKFNSEFTPEQWWLESEDDSFPLLGFGNFSGANR